MHVYSEKSEKSVFQQSSRHGQRHGQFIFLVTHSTLITFPIDNLVLSTELIM